MYKDRREIYMITGKTLDNPDKQYDLLEQYIEGVRAEAIGWTHADACVALDNGIDYREVEVPSILDRAKIDLACVSP